MTKEQLHILQHSLGVDQYGQGSLYRNHYVGGADECRPLVAMGYMIEMKPRCISGGEVWFMVTNEGKTAMRSESPKPPKLTQSQKRYREFLNASEAFSCTFREWLEMRKQDWYKKMKTNG
jgi:hypothetical protein